MKGGVTLVVVNGILQETQGRGRVDTKDNLRGVSKLGVIYAFKKA